MRIILIVWMIIVLSSCQSTSNTRDIVGKKIGVDYKLYESLSLCHSHLGFTVFQNTKEIYDIETDINELVTAGYMKGIKQANNLPIEVDSGIRWSNFLSYSSWDSSATLNNSGLEKLDNVSKKYDLDYLLIARDYEVFFKGEACNGAWFNTQNGSVRSFVPIYVALIFDAKSGEYVGTTFITNDNHKSAYDAVQDVSKLNEAEVRMLTDYSRDAATMAITSFFEVK
ncbi:hypothetical protein [Glaciecola sp. SC05]|uniref:hypothetical protein n=1 Tax=Glaciecola sp. SC05 TaxID=1987355 RepID=UPI003528E51A